MAKYFPVLLSLLFFTMIHLVLFSVAGPGVWSSPHRTIKERCSGYQDQARNGILFCTRESDPILGPDGKMHGNVCSMCQAFFQAEAKKRKKANAQARSKRASGNAPSYANICHKYRQYIRNGRLLCTRENDPIRGPNGKMYGNPCSMCEAFFQAEERKPRGK